MYGYNYLVTRTKSDGTPDMFRIKIGYFTGDNIEEKIYKTCSRSLTPVYCFSLHNQFISALFPKQRKEM